MIIPDMHPPAVRLAAHAMATRFELVLPGDDGPRLRAAGEAALEEIARVERLLSAYRPDSDVARINQHGARKHVRVTAETCRVLRQCVALSRASEGAFDITVGPLVRLWRDAGSRGEVPSADAIAYTSAAIGADFVHVDEDALTVALGRPGMAIDLGAAGKGYAVDLAIEILQEAGVTSALLHGGTSSVHAIGAPAESADGWPIAWAGPDPVHCLRDAALSVSASHGRAFTVAGVAYGHVLDPRSGRPIQHTSAAGVVGPASFLCDVLSTALMVRGSAWLPELRQRWPGYDAWTSSRREPAAAQ